MIIDYFDRRLGSSDESSEDDEKADQNVGLGLLSDSFLVEVPTLDPAELGNDENPFVEENILIEIEPNQDDLEVVDENDEGEEVVALEQINDNTGTFACEHDRQLILQFLESGCGCKASCSSKFSLNNYLEMRLEAAEIDHYQDHVNTLDQVILGQLRCLRNDSDHTERSQKQNVARKQPQTTYLIKGQHVCRDTYMFCHQIKTKRLKRILKMYNGC